MLDGCLELRLPEIVIRCWSDCGLTPGWGVSETLRVRNCIWKRQQMFGDFGSWRDRCMTSGNSIQAVSNRDDSGDQSQSRFLQDLISFMHSDFLNAGLHVDQSLAKRYVASLLTKRFVILTGLSGSGKTKMAQAFAAWIAANPKSSGKWPQVGDEIPSDRSTYFVDAADSLSIQFSNSQDASTQTKVTLPRALIQEWVDCIKANNFSRGTSVREIRTAVGRTTQYSAQLNSFETHLKAAAFASMDHSPLTNLEPEKPHYEIVAVGADWTSNERILGYPDALNPTRYARTQTLDLILRAIANPQTPHFLILDEMNLSHVESYFADFLSAIESGESIRLYDEISPDAERDGVPQSLRLPTNLFTIGTVNVDETTYMFSPKVLDRANTIEFRVKSSEIEEFLREPIGVSISELGGRGRAFAGSFLATSRSSESVANLITQAKLSAELLVFFRVLSEFGYEFGYRTALEISRFVQRFSLLSTSHTFEDAIDAQVYQKLLPRLNGSRARLEPPLLSLAHLCWEPRDWSTEGDSQPILTNSEQLVIRALDAANPSPSSSLLGGTSGDAESVAAPIYPLSAAKIQRMHRLLRQNGFTSFAEA